MSDARFWFIMWAIQAVSFFAYVLLDL